MHNVSLTLFSIEFSTYVKMLKIQKKINWLPIWVLHSDLNKKIHDAQLEA